MSPRKKGRKRISRRTFVRGAGVGSVGLVGARQSTAFRADAQAVTDPGIPREWDLEADVVVIGSGAAGLPAAIRAADQGASVIVVDANYDIGGMPS